MGFCSGSVRADEVQSAKVGKVKQIQKWYACIHSDHSLKMQVIQAKTGLPYEPKLIRYTNSEGELKRVRVELQSDFGVTHESYYFHKGRLVYIEASDEFRQFVGVEKIKTEQSQTIHVASRQRYSFEGDKCIQALGKQAEAKQASDLKPLLLKAEDIPFDAAEGESEYHKKAVLVSQIKSVSDLKEFVATYTK